MKALRSVCFGILGLVLSSCGENSSGSLLKGDRPLFQSSGQFFSQSVDCSPHSTFISLQVYPDALLGQVVQPYRFTKTIELNLDTQRIVRRVQEEGSPMGPLPTPQIESYLITENPKAFVAILEELRNVTKKLRDGNLCYKPQESLEEIVVYLKKISETPLAN